ncbi:MAG TPA: efflux transporter outer membrane subunit [Stellaceae bacterium]|nr:efflux transporter outer membrane subunit [Stellaceae bacterium]
MRPFPRTILLALLLSACAVGPNYVKPPVETPSNFKEGGQWVPAEPRQVASGQPWWSIYDDKTLDGLERQVDINNQNLKASEAAYREAVAIVGEDEAAFFPTVGLEGTGSRQSQAVGTTSSGTVTPGASGGHRISNSFTAAANASWVPDIWGKVRRQVESGVANAQASAADLAAARLSTQATLAQSYFELRITDELTRLLSDTVKAYARSLEITQNRYSAGVSARSDVAQAQAQLDGTRSQLIALGVQRAQYEHAIAVLIGKPPAEFALAAEPLHFHVPVVPTGVSSTLLERNPTVASAERQAASANALIGVAIAGYFPALTLSGSGGFTSSAIDMLFKGASSYWMFGADLTETVFNGFLTSLQVAQARATYDQNVALYRQAALTSFQQVEDQLAALRIEELQQKVEDSTVSAAELAERLIFNEYKAGTVDYTSVVTAQATALADEQSAYQIMQNRLLASVLLVEDLGGGWDTSQLPDQPLPAEIPDRPGAEPHPGTGEAQ